MPVLVAGLVESMRREGLSEGVGSPKACGPRGAQGANGVTRAGRKENRDRRWVQGVRACGRASVRACRRPGGRVSRRAEARAGKQACRAPKLKKEDSTYFIWKKSDNS